jgi:hypothetical protein
VGGFMFLFGPWVWDLVIGGLSWLDELSKMVKSKQMEE